MFNQTDCFYNIENLLTLTKQYDYDKLEEAYKKYN